MTDSTEQRGPGFASRIASAIGATDLRDVLGIAGASVLFVGVWQVYPPATYILAGAGMIVLSVMAARR